MQLTRGSDHRRQFEAQVMAVSTGCRKPFYLVGVREESQGPEVFEGDSAPTDPTTLASTWIAQGHAAMHDQVSLPSVSNGWSAVTHRTDRIFENMSRACAKTGQDLSADDPLKKQLERMADLGGQEHWLIPCDEIKLDRSRILGNGTYGIVYVADYHGADVAVKVPRITKNRSSMGALPSFANELRILRRVRQGPASTASHSQTSKIEQTVVVLPVVPVVLLVDFIFFAVDWLNPVRHPNIVPFFGAVTWFCSRCFLFYCRGSCCYLLLYVHLLCYFESYGQFQ
ncbi:unnamed protein product [Polarella glacialis]|uniref:Protein kinase domain-containing protein n=1 Tax=Polarella glacialis TaxID=89957 RepID=A0A813I0R9_POLGL|nr:unnamed protein product [Polarella glacialis]CAE8643542.1 unnamed protein product [Polarella glacialis]